LFTGELYGTIKKMPRDVTKNYPLKDFIQKLRRFADALEKGKRFEIQIAGKRIRVPQHAQVSIEHEATRTGEEIEFQIRWQKNKT